MNDSVRYNIGDRVRHTTRPEWGEGTVASAQNMTHEGQTVQRLIIAFANHGRVTVNAALAPITPITGGGPSAGWLKSPDQGQSHVMDIKALANLPEEATDPFSTLARRLRMTLDLYRYKRDPRSVLDWAVAQTGLDDPLSMFTRHDLEQQFVIFEHARDSHLRTLLITAKKKGEHAAIEEAKQHPLPEAQAAMQRAMRLI